jgi:hypothetical protein
LEGKSIAIDHLKAEKATKIQKKELTMMTFARLKPDSTEERQAKLKIIHDVQAA